MSDPNQPSSPATTEARGPYDSLQLGNVLSAVRELEHPTQVGPYHIQKILGEGGMGTVYLAEQREPVRREVALKLIKLGMDTRQVIARFESEQQALALMDHPHVARVLDAGVTESGRPYFVMEYVPGEPITTFADRHQLTVRQRLELFVQACDAVQHAHQKAIIHRDLKPSNILVCFQDGKPSVRVIDFGVAKALNQRLTEKTLFTEHGQLLGTPEYMAPEQAEANALDVDTRCDVYSLGVVLYELLSGSLPFDPKSLRSAGYNEIQRIIREVDPPRPSTRLSALGQNGNEIARLRQMPLESLARQLGSELEWIPMRAMRKDRSQRYATPRELADDIQNYITQRPLRAGPEAAAYRFRKWLRRNRRIAVAVSAVGVALVLGIIGTSWQAIRATRAEKLAVANQKEAESQRVRAESAADELREVNYFLTDDLLASASPEVMRGRELTVREALDRAADSVKGRFRDKPITAAAVQSILADTYDSLGLSARAMEHAQTAYDLLLGRLGPDDERTMEAAHELARLKTTLERLPEAETELRELLARSRTLFGDKHPLTSHCLASLAQNLRVQRRYEEAEQLYHQGLALDRQIHGPQSLEVANSLNSLAVLLNSQRRTAEAEPLYREALAIRGKQLGEDHPAYLGSLGNFARVLTDQQKLEEAELVTRRVLAEQRRILGNDHPSTTLSMNNLGWLAFERGQAAEAEALYREALERRRASLGEEHSETLISYHNLGSLMWRLGRYEEAIEPLLKAYEGRRKTIGDAAPQTLSTKSNLARAYETLGRYADAEPLLRELYDPKVLPTLTPALQAAIRARWGVCLAKLNQLPQAETVLLDAEPKLLALPDAPSVLVREMYDSLADVFARTNRPDRAAEYRAKAAAIQPTTAPTTAP